MSFIEISNLTKIYESDADRVEALRGVDIQVEEGTFLGVMGQSGSGKSTFLSILGGLAHPSAGRIIVDGIDLYALSGEKLADFRREYLGFVFQAFNLIPYLTAMENVMLPLAVKKMSATQKRSQALDVLERVGLAGRASHLPSQLSGGEQERVAVARALVNRPPLLLADEPTGSLDTATSEEIMDLLTSLNKEGQTIVMVTHDQENCRYFHRRVLLRDGLVVSDESTGLAKSSSAA
ncbi:putative ABC transport system ATP-binding protein [Geoalkalibacter ferrihydriticus]|uniref:ABC transporter ATP-binding protein n=2 Tax=Geoalkalibacter ferrihydriticus TaxID=392333 RepID=A0A0C2HUS3_9BACT|nr:ABC transporter ATP-binding protein [Geoalkalibacter ferrihydriticus]KIH76562.1 ABC transporter ATP-binding protein [Geoalkalibacter ferrihydriticus DSM 17813]SDM01612.1 putative ABC transport system ATP-binding protein [Geoalkalibacter ferrihydriticus]